MKVELDRIDIVNLLKGVSEYVPLSETHSLRGRFEGGGFNDPVWEWDESYLEVCSLEEMYKFYLEIKENII